MNWYYSMQERIMSCPLWLRQVWINIRFYWNRLLSHMPHMEIKQGDRFLVLRDIKLLGNTHFRAPVTLSFEGILPKGMVLVAAYDSVRLSTAFNAKPENYEEMEKKLVPENHRSSEKYNGYSLIVHYRRIGKDLKLIKF